MPKKAKELQAKEPLEVSLPSICSELKTTLQSTAAVSLLPSPNAVASLMIANFVYEFGDESRNLLASKIRTEENASVQVQTQPDL